MGCSIVLHDALMMCMIGLGVLQAASRLKFADGESEMDELVMRLNEGRLG